MIKLHTRQGFSLIEVLVAASFVTFSSIGLITLTNNATDINKRSKRELAANALLENAIAQRLDFLTGLPIDDLFNANGKIYMNGTTATGSNQELGRLETCNLSELNGPSVSLTAIGRGNVTTNRLKRFYLFSVVFLGNMPIQEQDGACIGNINGWGETPMQMLAADGNIETKVFPTLFLLADNLRSLGAQRILFTTVFYPLEVREDKVIYGVIRRETIVPDEE